MVITEVLFLLQFLIVMGLFVLKIYNVVVYAAKNKTVYDWPFILVFFVLGSIGYGVGLFASIEGYETTMLTTMFGFESYIFVMFFMLSLIEAILYYANAAVDYTKQQFNAKKYYQSIERIEK